MSDADGGCSGDSSNAYRPLAEPASAARPEPATSSCGCRNIVRLVPHHWLPHRWIRCLVSALIRSIVQSEDPLLAPGSCPWLPSTVRTPSPQGGTQATAWQRTMQPTTAAGIGAAASINTGLQLAQLEPM